MKEQEQFVDKYAPEALDDVQGNNKARRQLDDWLGGYSRHDRPQMLVGPPGVGKTTTVQLLAKEHSMPLMEINASDSRTTKDIAELAERASVTPHSADRQLVLLDEVDSMSSRTNLQPLYDLLDESVNPVVCVANDAWEVPNGIERRCNVHDFSLQKRSIKARLRDVVAEEGIEIGAATLNEVASRNNLRDALHDLQVLAQGGDLLADAREYESSLHGEVENVVKAKPAQFSEQPTKVIHWIDKNIRDRWVTTEAAVAFDALSRSDIWLQRASRGDYRWWKYANLMHEEVPNLRLTEAYTGYISIDSPDVYGKGWTNTERQLYEELSDAGQLIGCSFREFREVYLELLRDEHTDTELCELGVQHGLSKDVMTVLGVGAEQYESYRSEVSDRHTADVGSKSSSFMDVQ